MLRSFHEMESMVKEGPYKKRIILACAHDEHSLEAVYKAYKEDIADPILVGKAIEIKRIMTDKGLEFDDNEKIYDVSDDEEAARTAVRLIREEEGDFLMKGALQTADLLRQVVNKETGLQCGKIMSHIALFQVPRFHKLVVITDGGMILDPDLEQKKKIVENAVSVLHSLGYENPKVACICAAEKLNKKARESVDAAALKEMNQTGEIKGCCVEGPISYDIAMSKDIADAKNFNSPVAGDPDILLMPGITPGNMLGKAWLINGDGTAMMSGLIVGARVPIVLTSRGSSTEEKYYSIVLAAAVS